MYTFEHLVACNPSCSMRIRSRLSVPACCRASRMKARASATSFAKVRATRPGAAGYAIATIRGPASLDMAQTHRDFGDVVVGFDLANKDDYRDKTRHLTAAVGAALSVVSFPARPEKVVDSVYVFDSAGDRNCGYHDVWSGETSARPSPPRRRKS